MTVLFTTDDYATIPELVAAQSGNADDVEYQLLASISAGDITGFANGLRIFTTNDSTITGDILSQTDGLTTFQDVEIIGNLSGDNILVINGQAVEYSKVSSSGLDGYRLILAGDSTTYGRGANTSTVAGIEGAHVASPARQLASKLTALGVNSDSHSVVGMGNNTNADTTDLYFNETPDVSVTTNDWVNSEFDAIGGDIFRSNSGNTTLLVFAFDNVDRGAIGLPIRSYGVIEYRIDGGDFVQVNQTGTDDLLRIEVDFLTLGSHTVEFRQVSGNTAFVQYVEAWNSSSDVVVIPWGARGYTSYQLNDDTRPWSYKAALSYVPFDGIVLNIGINDVRDTAATNTPQADYEQNVTDYVAAIRAVNPNADIFINIPNDINSGTLDYLPTSITSLASTLNINLLDARNAVEMSTFAIANAAGHMHDNLHPTDTGYSNIYDNYTPIILNEIQGDASVDLITATDSKFNTVTGATLNNCLSLTSVDDCIATDTVSLTFTNSAGNYCVSSDASANFGANSLLSQPISTWLTVDDEINATGQAALTGVSSTGGNIIEWNWEEVVSSTISGTISNIPAGTYSFKFFNDDTNTLIESKSVTFTDESFSETLSTASGTNLFYITSKVGGDDNTGAADYGVTV